MHNKNNPYTPISAELINNSDLTGEERFLLIYLLGRSNDYILNSSYFAKQSQNLFGWGRDKFYKVWTNLQTKGYIKKQKIRTSGKIDGHHYTVHETIKPFLKNQNPENPESGKSGIWKTSALPSIDKPIIDKPNTDEPISGCATTKTNLNGASTFPAGGSDLLETNNQVTEIFELICEQNPSEYSGKWKLNDQDRNLIEEAIKEYGLIEAKLKVYQRVGASDKLPYSSTSYIFSDLKNEIDDNTVEVYIKDNPELITEFANIEFSDEKVENAKLDCENKQQFYDFLKNTISAYHEEAKHWVASTEDLEYCERLQSCDSNIPLAEKLRAGLTSAFEKDDWRFGQVVYQAVAAIDTKEMFYA